ncbi:MAG: GerMN domain-containing protein [Lachnospiraceae bacterium]
MKKKIIILFMVLGILNLFGCDKQEKGTEYKVYYREAGGNGITPVTRYVTSTDVEGIINELWGLFITPPENEKVVTICPEGLEILRGVFVESDTLNVYFNTVYSQMSMIDELMFRAAFVKTFVQIEGFSGIQFFIEESPLTDTQGNMVGRMKGSDFVDILSQDINEIESQIVTLYFTNETGDALIPQKMEARYGTGYALERYVLEALIEGPEPGSGLYPVVISNLKILSISVKDNTCYINFDNNFFDETSNVSDVISVYAIVDSLCELPGISKVQMSINGNTNGVISNNLNLTNAFERNLDYVQTELSNSAE